MDESVLACTADLRAELERSILLVGEIEDVLKALPELATDLVQCQRLKACGELPSEDPASELWNRMEQLKPERLWIAGGDGTINLVGQSALRVDWSVPCWLTPAGTANDLARALAEHSSYQTLVASGIPGAIVLQPTVRADLLAIKLDNNPWTRCAANMFTLGASARNTHHVTTEIKSRWGALAYLTRVWRAMGDLAPFTVRMRVGQAEERTISDILNIFVANGPYCGGGFRVAPPAQIDDGRMDVLILRQGTTAELAHLATAFLTGSHLDHPLLEHFTAENVSIHCEADSAITLDGESFQAKDISIEVCAGRLPINLVTTY